MADIDGRPLISHTVEAVAGHVDVCVVVCRREISATLARLHPDVTIAEGGPTRTASEMSGLAAIDTDVDLIGIHDAARPLIAGHVISTLFEAAESKGGAVPLLKHDGLIVEKSSHRPVSGLLGAQTPQVFRAPDLLAAYRRAAEARFEAHDTVEVVQRFSDLVIVGVEGDPGNVKVTYPGDIERVRTLLSGPSRT